MNIRHEAYNIIVSVLVKNVFSDKLLSQVQKRFKESGENADLLYVLVKGVIKMKANLDYIASQYTDPNKFSNTSTKIKILIYLALYQLLYCDHVPAHAAVNESVELAKKLYGEKVGNFVNAVLRSYIRSQEFNYPEDTVDRLSVEYSFPKEIIQAWLEYWGEEKTEMLCIYYNDIPKLNIRVNRFATEPDKLIEYFERRDVVFSRTDASENILITNQFHEVLNDIAFKEGYYSVQDPAAALVVELMRPELNESILDLFAAPGGKATYISELMCNTGEVIAVDKYPRKVKKIKQAIERLQITNMKLIAEDAFKYGPIAPAYDRVLLDVPCTGWGVFQKKAELRWQINQDTRDLLKLQENALKRGAQFVRPGGFLVYSTCTMNKEENERQVEKFLARYTDFELVPAEKFLPSKYTENGYLKTLPFEHNMDGAFAAKLRKIK